ncbi:hypothetical protein SAMN05661003_1168 [Desulfuromonas thiophila]|uniref:Uncharacterized protein n=1 Tax=Desulfuromonas thiophila TaxID=57664 RepID=A0A1G7DW72_9BACT|nr:hypothetical protein [Desulfuromonas thiophila]SDE55747.1 hypothetical protein SAMN05661003_1168 [Desulfuromonas thiophila]
MIDFGRPSMGSSRLFFNSLLSGSPVKPWLCRGILTLIKAVISLLKDRPEEKFTARQIADWVFATYPDECQAKTQSSQALVSDAGLVQQIIREISSQLTAPAKKHVEFKMTEGRPRKYYYSEKSDSAEVVTAEGSSVTTTTVDDGQAKVDEHALYPLLSRYPWEEFGVFFKRIDEKRSSNNRDPNGNSWLLSGCSRRGRFKQGVAP